MTRAALRTLALLLASAGAAHAQDDRSAGLFTAEARQLPLVAQALTVEVIGDEARVHLVQDFVNDGAAAGQADYQLALPTGASVEGFGFWTEDRFLEATLQSSEQAEASHQRAAAQGRSTGMLREQGRMHSFSVYPVAARSTTRVETTVRLPVEMDLGRSQLRLPIDRFLGQPGPDSTVLVDLQSLEPLAELGIEGSEPVVLSRGTRTARLAWSGDEAATLWWQEEAPPLLMKAARVPLYDGAEGIQLRVVLHDADGMESSWERTEVLVDGSFSMRRRAGALRTFVSRLQERGGGDIGLTVVADGTHRRVDLDRPARVVVDDLLSGGHRAGTEDFRAARRALGCGGGVRCVAVADAQLDGLADLSQDGERWLLLADPHEKAWLARLPEDAALYQVGVDSEARLRSLSDELVLPVLELDSLALDGRELEGLSDTALRVAEGGMLKRFFEAPSSDAESLQVLARLGEETVRLDVPLRTYDAGSPAGQAARIGWYRASLARMMASYRADPDEDLKHDIVAISLREQIPTAFTALQVDDPELSLAAIKPGDPTLTVHGEAGLTEVAAWYPFGDVRRLVSNGTAEGDFSDRFLVPRYWDQRAYRVEVFKAFDDGSESREQVWYVLDEDAPQVELRLDDGLIEVDAGAEGPDIGSVRVQSAGAEWAIERDEDGLWRVPTDSVVADFHLLVRDRAGNRSTLAVHHDHTGLSVEAGSRVSSVTEPVPWSDEPVFMGQADNSPASLVQVGDVLELHHGDRRLRAANAPALRSLVVESTLDLPDGRVLVGTRGGDLLAFSGEGVAVLPLGQPEHPVSGMVRFDDGTVLIGVLGEGLFEWSGTTVRPSRLRVGSAFITGLDRDADGTILVATAYNGLWRVSEGGLAWKARFASDHVTGLRRTATGLEIRSGLSTWTRTGRDRFTRSEAVGNGLSQEAPDLTAAVHWAEQVAVAGFDTGLHLLEGGTLVPFPLPLDVSEKRINDLAVHEGWLWLATEGGVLALSPDGRTLRRLHAGASYDLDVGEAGVAMASSKGLRVQDGVDGEAWLLDRAADGTLTAGTGKWMSVAWHEDSLYAGGMEGLVRFAPEAAPLTVADGFDANWVTALASGEDGLAIGTYADGVWRLDDAGVAPMAGLAGSWVPPHALHHIDGDLYVGGIGEPARRATLGAEGVHVEALRVPARDINGFLPLGDGTILVVTSDGLAVLGETELAVR